jgi:hypothetical protein
LIDGFVGGGLLANSSAMDQISRKRREGESEKQWDAMVSVALSFICIVGDNVMINFPRKNMSFCFNHLCDPDVGSRSQKVREFKRF